MNVRKRGLFLFSLYIVYMKTYSYHKQHVVFCDWEIASMPSQLIFRHEAKVHVHASTLWWYLRVRKRASPARLRVTWLSTMYCYGQVNNINKKESEEKMIREINPLHFPLF